LNWSENQFLLQQSESERQQLNLSWAITSTVHALDMKGLSWPTHNLGSSSWNHHLELQVHNPRLEMRFLSMAVLCSSEALTKSCFRHFIQPWFLLQTISENSTRQHTATMLSQQRTKLEAFVHDTWDLSLKVSDEEEQVAVCKEAHNKKNRHQMIPRCSRLKSTRVRALTISGTTTRL